MSTTRAARARRLFRRACILWAVLILLVQFLHAPYLQGRWRAATWDLSASALTWLWVGAALWSGAVHVGYRGIHSRTVYRSETPAAFWWHVGIGTAFAVGLAGWGLQFLGHHA